MNFRSICLLACLLCLGLAAPLAGAGENPPTLKQVIGPKKAPPAAETAPQKPAAPDKPSAPTPAPEAGGAQESPRSVMLNFVQAARQGDYKTAATYLDLSSIPKEQRSEEGPHLAYRLMAAGTHTMWLALDTLSPNPKGNLKDGLPPDREKIGTIDVPNGSVDLILHRVRGPGHKHRWLISPGTVSQIDLLYSYHGYGPLGETLSKLMPDRWVLGMQVWQWAALFVLAALCYLAAWGLTSLTVHLLARRTQGLGPAGKRLLRGPLRLLLTALFFSWSVDLVSPSVTFMAVMKGHSLITAAVLWCLLCLVDLTRERLTRRLREAGNQQITVLLKPVGNILKIVLCLIAVIVWMDNLGFKVTTILASLGVGGLAVALAAQDILKNFLGSMVILLDKPFRVGERIVLNGHDGVVEELGLRSVKLRQLDGHQMIIPNEQVVTSSVENIGRRNHIRRMFTVGITYDTPPDKARRAVEIVQEILKDHEGCRPGLPPRVYLSEFGDSSLNIQSIYWYHPADYWAYMAFSQKVNLQILERLAAEGIDLAFPTTTAFLASDPERPLRVETVAGAGGNAPTPD